MGERRGTKGLELWCKRMTEGYPGVKVDNMTTSWRDGLAFCAIIHHFRPDLIEFAKLNKNDIYYNNKLAFRVAEDHLGIPALLEPEDMVEYSVPDRLSILTYLSQFYQAFAVNQSALHICIPGKLDKYEVCELSIETDFLVFDLPTLEKRHVDGNSQIKSPAKRPPPTDLQMHMVSGTSSTPPKKASLRLSGARREPCAKCGHPVFIAERLNVGEALYHRTCFRCARCDSQLTLANYYETENGEFCCETCPDEEKLPKGSVNILSKSLSDEEKSASLKGESDIFSSNFENALEDPKDNSLRHNFTLNKVAGAAFMRARSEFMTTQVDLSTSDSDSDSSRERKPPDLPISQVPQIVHKDVTHIENMDAHGINMLPSFSDNDPSSCKLKDQTTDQNVFESQNAVTKDSISAKNEPVLSSIKSRIKLFEGNAVDHHEIRKSDVNRESLSLSIKIDKVPYVKSSDEVSSNRKHSSNESAGEYIFEHSENDEVVEFHPHRESSLSTIDDLDRCEKSVSSESYQADISDLNNSAMLIERNESFIVASSETSSVNENVIAPSEIVNSASLSEPNESIITISSESSFENKDENPSSSKLKDDSSLLNESNDSVIVISSETSEYNKKICPLFESKISDTDTETNKFLNALSSTSEEKLEALPETVDTCENPQEKSVESADCKIEHQGNLNPFDHDEKEEENMTKTSKSASLNPFSDTDDEEEENQESVPKSTKLISLNPFEDTDEEEENQVESEKPTPAPRLIYPPKSTNPFDSDDEDIEVPALPPQPAVRKLIKVTRPTLTPYWNENPSPVPKERSPIRNNSDASSITGSGRKKKPAPKPPTAASCFNQDSKESSVSSITSSPSHSVCNSPKTTAKVRKMKKAPLPPGSSTPLKSELANFISPTSPVDHDDMGTKPLLFRVGSAENLKSAKDEMNRNRQHISTSLLKEGPSSLPNKSTYGKWKRRKGQAPVRPIPQRRSIKILPINEIKHELELIEIQQLGLEKQGVKLEKLIRERSEVPGISVDETLEPEAEDMVLQLFELVNEKNELFRKQAELMYLRRQHRLEEEHAEVEYQIRCLMLQPESNKTDSDKAKEDELINRLVEIVERRNEIVDCLEMNRQRAADEDNSIINQMSLFTMKRDDSTTKKKSNKKDKSKHKKDKEKKSKSKYKTDVDKDIDETDTSFSKEKKKKKFNLFS